MSVLVEVGLRPGVCDAAGRAAAQKIRAHLGIPVREVRVRRLYRIEPGLSRSQAELACHELFADPIIQDFSIDAPLEAEPFDQSVLVTFRPGVTDNEGRTAAAALAQVLEVGADGAGGASAGSTGGADDASAGAAAGSTGGALRGAEAAAKPGEAGLRVQTATRYLLSGVSRAEAERIARELLANELIEQTVLSDYAAWRAEGSRVPSAEVRDEHCPQVAEIDLEVGEPELARLSRERVLALSVTELAAIRDYFRDPGRIAERRARGLGPSPTDVELEALAQTWSEHCHHKVFNGEIRYTGPDGSTRTIHSLFRTFIRATTEKLASPWLVSVFTDNAGVIRFNERLCLAYKVETHNSPSALDPYGGAMTGIVGVNRDPFGTGLGAHLIANVWGYCLGDPFYKGELPLGLLHPARVRDGVHRGVIEGGNQSGIPYARGWELFEERFMGKPLVFCGTLGELPPAIGGVSAAVKSVQSGDAVVMVGGRVGKDGIHGATFSSEELHAGSPVQAVQIGDPITQKRMTDMLLEARDRLLYRALTDNGAGGLSSSVGEMAQLAGGCQIDLARVPLKYAGLDPWEILVSEAQERMTVAVPPEKLDAFLELARRRGVEATALGSFTSSGRLHVRHGERTVALLELDFLHRGDPPYRLEARLEPRSYEEPDPVVANHAQALREMLSRLNLCSLEAKARQYDHEVQGRSVIKPFGGRFLDVPTDATVLLAEYGGREGIVLAEGVNPFYSDLDAYWMASSAVDLAVRRVVGAGGDPDFISGLDNFCWPNVVKEHMPERAHKLAQLVRACEGLADACAALGVPLISGKDSMSNDCTLTDPPISIPPTLLVSVLGRLEDVGRAVTVDPKSPGDLLYLLGETRRELGASEFYRYYGEKRRGRAYVGNAVPVFDGPAARALYGRLHQAMRQGLVRSCHTPALGGLAAALARKALAGGWGLEADLSSVPGDPGDDVGALYSESNSRFLVTVTPADAPAFEKALSGSPCARIGVVSSGSRLVLRGRDGKLIVRENLQALRRRWKETLGEP
jgi:phosphoribosylformylglycinamidine synthase